MLVFALRRMLATIPILLAATLFTFLLVDIAGDPVAPLRRQVPRPPPRRTAAATTPPPRGACLIGQLPRLPAGGVRAVQVAVRQCRVGQQQPDGYRPASGVRRCRPALPPGGGSTGSWQPRSERTGAALMQVLPA
jgi:hypothetical protein